MEKSCAKCSKLIAGASNQCIGCGFAFHPGCARVHLQSKSVRDFCLHNLASSSDCSSLSQSLTTRSRLNLNMSSASGDRDVSFSNSPSAVHHNLDESLAKLIALHEQTDAKITAFSHSQDQTNAQLRSLITKISTIDAAVSAHALRLSDLELTVQSLKAENAATRDNHSVNLNSHAMSFETKSELFFSGMPSRDDISPTESIKRVFEVLGIPELSCHVLSVRKLPINPIGAVGQPTTNIRISYIVTLTSLSVRDIVLAKKREKRELKWFEVFETCPMAARDFNIFVNEMLSASTYKLLRRVKSRALITGYKYVWPRDGKIYARKADGQPRFEVKSEDDLGKAD